MKIKQLLAASLIAVSSASYTQTIDTSKLTPQQVAAINQIVTQNQNTSAVVREEAEKWADIGVNVTKALVAGAKELGIAANEFAGTTVGKVVIVAIVWKVFGEELRRISSGLIMLLVAIFAARWLLVTKRFYTEPRWEYKPYLFGLWNRKVLVGYERNSEIESRTAFAYVILIVGTIISALVIS